MRMLRRLIPLLLLLTVAVAQTPGTSQASPPLAKPATHPRPVPSHGFTIGGTVVNALTGEPLHHAEITIGKPQEADALQTADSGTDGHFSFSNLDKGKYWLAADGTGFPRQAYQQHEQFSTAVAVGPGLASENIEFRVYPDAVISGTITDEQNDPVRDAQVMLFHSAVSEGRKQTGLYRQAGVDDRGHYRFGHLPAGTYFVAVSAQPWFARYVQSVSVRVRPIGAKDIAPTENSAERSPLDMAYPITYYSGATDSNGATPIVVGAGDRNTADITLSAVPALHLHISDPEAAQGQGVNVSLNQTIFGDFSAPVNAQVTNIAPGQVEVAGVAPGQYNMEVELYGNDSDSGGSVREQKVDVQNDVDLSAGSAAAKAQVSGVVEFEGSVPQQAYIRLWNHSSTQFTGTQISPKGEFDLGSEPIPTGDYEVMLMNAGGYAPSRITATGAKVDGRMVHITGGGGVRLRISTTRGLGKIDGTAMQEGKPTGGAMIVLVPQDLQNNLSLVRRDQSDSDGTFSLDTVLPGRYTVLALANGWDLEWQNPDVLNSYLGKGEVVQVEPGRKYQIKVKVQ
jgi:hypothetical protein